MKSTFAIVKRLLASNKISFIITALVVLCAIIKDKEKWRHDCKQPSVISVT